MCVNWHRPSQLTWIRPLPISPRSPTTSAHVARGNGILSKVIGEMNLTIQGSIRNMESLAKEVQRVELTGQEEAKAWAEAGDEKRGEAVAELSASIALVQKEATSVPRACCHIGSSSTGRECHGPGQDGRVGRPAAAGRRRDREGGQSSGEGRQGHASPAAVETKHIQGKIMPCCCGPSLSLESVSQEVEALQAGWFLSCPSLAKLSPCCPRPLPWPEVLGERVNV